MSQVVIDPNVRVLGNRTFAGLENVTSTSGLRVGQAVEAVEIESEMRWPARVFGIVTAKSLVYLTVDWANGSMQ